MAATPRGLRKPVAGDSPDVVRDVSHLADDVDAMYAAGTFATRPPFGLIGREYYASDTGNIYLDIGTAWILKGGSNILRSSDIGTEVQEYDAELAAFAGLVSAADKLGYFTGAGSAATTDFTTAARTLIAATTAAAQRAALGLVIGTDIQAQDAELAAFAGLVSAADKLPYFTGAGTASLATLSSFIRTLLDDTDATAARATIGAKPDISPTVRAFHSADQAIADSVTTMLSLNSESFDNDTIHDAAVNNSRLTCRTAGKYLITGNFQFAANQLGGRSASIRKNGATIIAVASIPVTSAAMTANLSVTVIEDMAVNDYVELAAFQTSGGALNVVAAGNYTPEFSMTRLGA